MKKILITALILVITFSLYGCGDNRDYLIGALKFKVPKIDMVIKGKWGLRN